jgi:hypothetical protein
MRAKLRSIAAGLTALVLAGLLSSCGIQPPATSPTGTSPPATATPAAAVPPAAPGPVSTAATLGGHCTMGWMPTGQGAVFESGQPNGPQVISGTDYYPVIGYQLTLTNNGSATADIDGWVVAFYDNSGTELGSDEENISDEFLTSGQSFTWTEYAPDDTDGNSQSFGNDQSIPADGSAASCQIIQWLYGSS